MTGRPLLGILLAVIVESSHWTRIRWDFNDQGAARAWQLSAVAIAISGALIYLESSSRLAMPILLTWLPPLLLPVQFIQVFGMKTSLPLNMFSFLAKQRRQRNLRLGLTESEIHFNFGNVYFIVALLGCAVGNAANGPSGWLYLPATAVLVGWKILATNRSRWFSLLIALAIASGISIVGQKGLEKLDDHFTNRGLFTLGFDPNSTSTLIGKPGPVEQSADILWRLQSVTGRPPTLLRTASYNTYRENGRWFCNPLFNPEFRDLDTRLEQGQPYYLLARDSSGPEQIAAVNPQLPHFTLRGAASEYAPLPLPGDTASLQGFELDGIDRNFFGTVRLFPKHSVIAGKVLLKADCLSEDPVVRAEDLKIPFLERRTLKSVLQQLHLLKPTLWQVYQSKVEFTLPEKSESLVSQPRDSRPLSETLAILRTWFQREFRYSRDLTIAMSPYLRASPTAIEQFLTTDRTGHCEYFATATVLLLREAGIPARYATGFAVMERDANRNEYVIRGTHGHAWCRVWDAGAQRWIDFDTTPGGLSSVTPPPQSWFQRFSDQIKRLREDFFLWQNQPENRTNVTVVIWAVSLALLAFITKKLWKSKRTVSGNQATLLYDGALISTPLNALERLAAKRLGTRPTGTPLAEWLSQLRPALADVALLDEALALHQRLRFDPAPAPPNEQARLAVLAKKLAADLKG
jgi:protein-glutamine gamma-glutamyltransferase